MAKENLQVLNALDVAKTQWYHFSAIVHVITTSGKAGAIIGAFGFLYASQGKSPDQRDAGYPAGIGIRNSLFVLAACNLLGIFFTFLVPEAKGKSLEEISGDNIEEEDEDNGASYV